LNDSINVANVLVVAAVAYFSGSSILFIYRQNERDREREGESWSTRACPSMSACCASLECVTNFVSVEKQQQRQQHFKRYLSLFLSLAPLTDTDVCYLLTEMIYTYNAAHSYH